MPTARRILLKGRTVAGPRRGGRRWVEDGAKLGLRAEGGTLGEKQWVEEVPSHPSGRWGLVGLLSLLVKIESVGCPGGLAVKTPPVNAVDTGSISGREDPLEEETEPTPVFLPGRSHGQRSPEDYVQSIGSQRVEHDEHACVCVCVCVCVCSISGGCCDSEQLSMCTSQQLWRVATSPPGWVFPRWALGGPCDFQEKVGSARPETRRASPWGWRSLGTWA